MYSQGRKHTPSKYCMTESPETGQMYPERVRDLEVSPRRTLRLIERIGLIVVCATLTIGSETRGDTTRLRSRCSLENEKRQDQIDSQGQDRRVEQCSRSQTR